MSEERRAARIERRTTETQIELELCLDGRGQCRAETGGGFFDHMLNAFARHGLFDLEVNCQGDLEIDAHHTVEDIGICLGQAIAQAVGDKVLILADGGAALTKSLDTVLDLTERGLGLRCQRFSMVVVDGVVQSLHIDPAGSFEDTSAEKMLGKI